MKTRTCLIVGILFAATALVGCGSSAPKSTAAPISTTAAVAALATEIYVYKSPTCSCCHEWEAYLRAAGYTVNSVPTENMSELKGQMNIPESAWSCHTAVIDGYVVEGHVPIEAITDMLRQHADIDGISLPGMPAGSPGMPGVKAAPLAVLTLDGGDTSSFGSY